MSNMKTLSFRHSFEAKHQPEIHATMLDFRLFGNVHPLMVDVKLIAAHPSGESEFDVKEETKVGGWLKMKPRYTVFVSEPVPNEKIFYRSRVMGIMQLNIDITYSETNSSGQFELIETVHVSRIPLITKMFLKIFGEAHTQAFANLRQHLAAAKPEFQNT